MQRQRFLRAHRRVVGLQRAVRRWLSRRNAAAAVIQRSVRAFLARTRRRKLALGIIKFQVNTSCKKITGLGLFIFIIWVFFGFFSHGFLGRGKIFASVDGFISEIASQVSFALAVKAEGKQIMKEY